MLIMFILQETFSRINNILIPFHIIFLLALAPGEVNKPGIIFE